ncbi:MAG: FAD-dependent oxidoreductase [Chloroflexi bacterium]|nr:FAD-dependent oxidoreductase [Chloroflexota bacterium]
MAHIVVIGAGYAGALAALRLRRGRGHQVTLVNASPNFVERVRLHQAASSGHRVESPLAPLIAGRDSRLVTERVTALRLDRREVQLEGGGVLTYDRLIYALGSHTGSSGVPGVTEHAHRLTGPEAAGRLYEALMARPAGRLLVVGGGLTGIEAATEIAEQHPGWQVTLMTGGTLGADLSPRGQEYLRRAFQRLRIEILERQRVTRLEAGQAFTADGRVQAFDLCLWAGSFDVSPLARESGFEVDRVGRIVVDAALRSVSHPEVYAIGDAAASGLRMACATAMPMGAHAADNVLADLDGGAVQPHRFGYVVRCISLGRHDGLIQIVDRLDRPRDRIVTGRAGAFVKELICVFARRSLDIEKRLPGAYLWVRSEMPASLLPLKSPA